MDNQNNRQWNWFLCNEPSVSRPYPRSHHPVSDQASANSPVAKPRFEWWQDGAPRGTPTIVSRLVPAAYWRRQCALFFPPADSSGGGNGSSGYGGDGPAGSTPAYGLAHGLTAADVNARTGGWTRMNTTRVMWANGEFDPWRDATVSADQRPDGPLQSTAAAPVHVIPDGIHCSDLLTKAGRANAGVAAVQKAETETMLGWVKEFYEGEG